jgi:phospholipase C
MPDSRVEYVVVLMFENRSFDHLLGHLDHGGLEPVTTDWFNLKDPSDEAVGHCPAHFLPSDSDVVVDPGHGFDDVVRQLTGAEPPLSYDDITMGGFAWNYRQRLLDHEQDPALLCQIMGCHTANQVPALTTLAKEYAVCSRWFCSVPTETWPNRLFAHGAQSEALMHNAIQLYSHDTTFDALSDSGESWAIYAGDVPQAGAYVELGDAFRDRFNTTGEFFEDVADDTLPKYSFIEPRHFIRVDSQHPVHSVMLGDQFLRRVYEALASSRAWPSVLLVVTWDEHGGFADRQPPPRTVSPHPGELGPRGFDFDVLGVRVPAVVVSPFIEAGTVDDELHDHSSIVRTVLDQFVPDRSLTPRDAAANTVLPLLTRSDARPPVALPEPPPALLGAVAEEAPVGPLELDDLQQSLVELTRLLDEHRNVPALLAEPVGPITTREQAELLVSHFQVAHLGNRESRLAGSG